MGEQYIMTIEHLTRLYDEKEVLSDIWLAFYPGAKIGVLGDNGSGKSTLLRIMAGEDTDFMGTVRPAKGIRIGYFPQEPRLDPEKTVGECIEDAVAESRAVMDRFNEISMKFGEDMSPEEMETLLEEQAKVQDKIDASNLWELDRTLEIAADAMGLPEADSLVENLSGGEKRRVALCQLLLMNPDILLLDEPTNHLDAESVAWLEQFLKSFSGTVVAITHDRYFLDNVAGWILELDRGKGIPYEGNYSSWLEQKQKRLEKEERSESRRQKELKQELEWSRMSPKARATKNKANGAGKTTLFRIIMGQEQPDAGTLIIGDSVSLSYVDQTRDALDPNKTVYEEISDGHDTLEVGKARIHARSYCGRFNFRGSDQQKNVGSLSGGERNRVHLAKLLRSGGNLLLLDEPTNDLDVHTLRALEEGLTTFGGCAVVVSHDRWFLDRIATHILAFEGGTNVVWCEGNYRIYEQERKARLGDASEPSSRSRFKPLTRA
jgi:sulfate-transporting ATPase